MTNTGNNPVSSVIFQLDSFKVMSETQGFNDTSYSGIKVCDLDSFKVSFTVFTNKDSTDYDYTRFSIVDNGTVILTHSLPYVPNGSSFVYYGYSSEGNINKTFNIDLGIRVPVLHSGKFLMVKNFKVETL